MDEIKTPLVAGLYARVSSTKQEEQQTIDSQISEIKSYIKEDGNVLLDDNVFLDDGWSGSILVRPGLDKMRDAARSEKFKKLYIYDRGRLARKFAYQELVIEELLEKDIEIFSLHDKEADTPEAKVLQSMQGVFHEFEKVKIAERFRRGKLYKAKQGLIINGSALYGYSYIQKTGNTPTKYEINEEEAEVVRKIFRWVGVEGLSINGVIKRLYKLGIQPRKRRRDVWSKGPVVRMLKNKTYFNGIAYYNKSEAVVSKNPINKDKYKKVKKSSRRVRPKSEWYPFKVPKLFDSDFLYKRVQKILEDNKKFASKNRKYNYLLQGKTYCEHGSRRVGDGYSKGQHHYYRSAAAVYAFPKKADCDCRGVNAVVLDIMFWDKLYKIMITPEILKKQAKRWLKQRNAYSESSKNELDKLNIQIKNLKKEEVRYAKMFGEGMIDSTQFKELMRGVKDKKRKYQDEIKVIKERITINKEEVVNVNDLCVEAQRVIKSLDVTDKKKVIREIVDKVVIGKGGDEVETWVNIPLIQAHQMGYGAKRRDSENETPTPGSNSQLEPEPTFFEDKIIPLQFTVKMPPPRYYPMILERDKKGRIISSKFPRLSYKQFEVV